MLPGVIRSFSNGRHNASTALFRCYRRVENGQLISGTRFVLCVTRRRTQVFRYPPDMGTAGCGHVRRLTSVTHPSTAENTKDNLSVLETLGEEEIVKEEEPPPVRSDESTAEYLKRHNVTISGFQLESHITSVSDVGFPSDVADVLRENRINEPTPIQSVTWSVAFCGRDLVGISPTGSGKTLGFLLPAITTILRQQKTTGHRHKMKPKVFVLTPTRELALQISRVLGWFRRCHLYYATVFGGQGKEIQTRQLENGVHVIVGTPGRCIDLINSMYLCLDECDYVILDEADTMLDMGFIPQVRQIMKYTKAEKQTLLYSATWPKSVEKIAQEFLRDYVLLRVGAEEETPNTNVKQEVIVCSDRLAVYKRFTSRLRQIVDSGDQYKILVFVQTKLFTEELKRKLLQERFHVDAIHGDLSQAQRVRVLKSFRKGEVKILIATAVASRGLDIIDITHVINFDFPSNTYEYVHKVGRTARYNRTGSAITFVTPENDISYLPNLLKNCGQEITDDLKKLISRKAADFRKKHQRPPRKNPSRNWWDHGRRVRADGDE